MTRGRLGQPRIYAVSAEGENVWADAKDDGKD